MLKKKKSGFFRCRPPCAGLLVPVVSKHNNISIFIGLSLLERSNKVDAKLFKATIWWRDWVEDRVTFHRWLFLWHSSQEAKKNKKNNNIITALIIINGPTYTYIYIYYILYTYLMMGVLPHAHIIY